MGGYRVLIITGGFLCGLVLAGREAAAQPTAKEQAAQLFTEATGLFDRGMYLDALKKFRRARALYASFKIDLNIGATLDAMGRRTEAAGYIEKFLINADKAPPPIIAAARQRLEQLRKKLARVKVTCLVDGAMVRVGHRSVGRTPLELPIYLEPGSYVISAHKKQHRSALVSLTLRVGQYHVVDLPVERVAASQPVIVPPPRRPVAPASQPRPAPSTPTGKVDLARERRSKTTSGYVLLGVGLAATVTAAVFIGLGVDQGDEAHKQYLAATKQSEMELHWADVEAGRNKVITGLSVAGVAMVIYGIAVYQLFTRPSAEEVARSKRPPLILQPARGGAVLSIGGHF